MPPKRARPKAPKRPKQPSRRDRSSSSSDARPPSLSSSSAFTPSGSDTSESVSGESHNSTSSTPQVSTPSYETSPKPSPRRAPQKKKTKNRAPTSDNPMDDFDPDEPPTYDAPPPMRRSNGDLIFQSHPDFVPNRTPEEVLRAGSFGGTYFRPIHSGVTGLDYGDEVWKELPKEWIEGLDVPMLVSSPTYRPKVNKYKVKCGQGLLEWESSGWIRPQDPYGWFQWYCRYFRGRRTKDDERQISRWKKLTGPTGRFRNNLIGKILNAGTHHDDANISPVIRQVLLHWGYEVTPDHVTLREKVLKTKR